MQLASVPSQLLWQSGDSALGSTDSSPKLLPLYHSGFPGLAAVEQRQAAGPG